MNKSIVLLSFLVLSAPVLAQATSPANAPETAASRLAGNKIDKTQLSSNIDSLGKLLESSSAARQIESSKAPDALQRRDRARELYRSAKTALDQGNLEKARREFHVGNLYLNRKCTGALVGVHPFGGFNMSGTDSKAGGREYLLQFMQGKMVTQKV